MKISSCPVEEEHDDWMDFDSFAANSTERLQNPNFFGPQLQHRSTEYAGYGDAIVICSRPNKNYDY